MSRPQARHLRLVQPRPAAEPRRFYPACGQTLTLSNIRGPWRPSGSVAGAGIFAVIWQTYTAAYWAPLHDFALADQLRLIEACRRIDQEAGLGLGWPA